MSNSSEKQTSEAIKERRATPRYEMRTPMEWKPREAPLSAWSEGRLIDLSLGGAAFSTPEDLQIGIQVSLRVSPPPDRAGPGGRTVTVTGTTVNKRRTNDGSYRYGVQFEKLYYVFAEWFLPKSSP